MSEYKIFEGANTLQGAREMIRETLEAARKTTDVSQRIKLAVSAAYLAGKIHDEVLCHAALDVAVPRKW